MHLFHQCGTCSFISCLINIHDLSSTQDRRIAHMPYHALTPAERETFNARRRLLAHLGDIIRQKATEKERQRLEDEERMGRRSM